MNFGEIKSTVADYLNRTDLTNNIPFWVNTAMRKIERINNFNYMLSTTTSLAFADGSDSVTPPSDLKEVVWWYAVENNSKNFLEHVARKEIEKLELDTSPTEDRPTKWAWVGTNFKVVPTADQTYTNKMLYYAKSAELSSDSDTNWLTNNVPEVLIYGALLEATPYLKDDQRIAVWNSYYEGALAELTSQDNSEAWSTNQKGFYRV